MSFLLKDNTRDSSSMRVFCQERVRIATRIEGLSDISDMSNGILIDAAHPRSLDDIEEHFFEFYRDAAESVTGLPITVIAEYDDLFATRIRAILRSAVYGDFSLLLRGILSKEEQKEALDLINKSFCELESEGREFNGYIQRGLCIDTPLLLRQSEYKGLDFLAIDAERLLYLMTGHKHRIDKRIIMMISAQIAEIIEKSDVNCAVILGERTTDGDFCKRLTDSGAYSFFVSPGNEKNTLDILTSLSTEPLKKSHISEDKF